MLDIIAHSVPNRDGRLLFRTPDSLSPILQAILGGSASATGSDPCVGCGGPTIALLTGFLVPHPLAVLLDSPVSYCGKENVLEISHGTAGEAQHRIQRARGSKLSQYFPNRAGVIGTLSRHSLGSTVLNYFPTGVELHHSPSENVLLPFAELAAEEGGDCLPEAILFHSIAFPDTITLKIEPTTRCNFGCEFCYGRHLAQGDIRVSQFTAILDQLPQLRAVELTGEGEPLLHPHIFQMLEFCRDRGIATHVTTNGSFLSEQACNALLESGLDSLAVSLETLDPERFPHFRVHGRLATVLEGIRRIIELRRLREKPLAVHLWVTLLRSTLRDFQRIAAFAAEVGVDRIEYQTLNPMKAYTRFYPEYLLEELLTPGEMRTMLKDPSLFPDLRTAIAEILSVYSGRRCDIFMHTIMTDWQGNVTPCCLLKSPSFSPFGNLKADSLSRIWDNPDFVLYRFALQHGIVLDPCRGCPDVASA